MSHSQRHTHRVAVIGYVFDGERFLLLKRATRPELWAPPGGRLEVEEDPKQGLLREIAEETGLNVRIIAPVDTWFHSWYEGMLLSIDFVVHPLSHSVQLSSEHSAYRWMTLEEIEASGWFPETSIGFKVSDFKRAVQVYRCFQSAQ